MAPRRQVLNFQLFWFEIEWPCLAELPELEFVALVVGLHFGAQFFFLGPVFPWPSCADILSNNLCKKLDAIHLVEMGLEFDRRTCRKLLQISVGCQLV